MHTATLYRLSGAALAVSALSLAAVTWAERFTGPDLDMSPPLVGAAAGPVHMVSFVTFVLFLPGLVGLYLAQRHRFGALGVVGVGATAVGFWCGVLPHTVLDIAAFPPVFAELGPEQAVGLGNAMYEAIGPLSTIGLPLSVLGLVAVAVATLRARVLPRWTAIVGLAAVPAAVLLGVLNGLAPELPVPHPPVALDLALLCYGVVLLRRPVASPDARRVDEAVDA